jgi:hypothetical protein
MNDPSTTEWLFVTWRKIRATLKIGGQGVLSEIACLYPLREPSRRHSSPLNYCNHPPSSIVSGLLRPILGPNADRACDRHQKKQHGTIKKTLVRKRDFSDSTASRQRTRHDANHRKATCDDRDDCTKETDPIRHFAYLLVQGQFSFCGFPEKPEHLDADTIRRSGLGDSWLAKYRDYTHRPSKRRREAACLCKRLISSVTEQRSRVEA